MRLQSPTDAHCLAAHRSGKGQQQQQQLRLQRAEVQRLAALAREQISDLQAPLAAALVTLRARLGELGATEG